MSIPEPTPMQNELAQAQAGPGVNKLWRDSPGWRNLVLAAIGLSAALVFLPLTITPDKAHDYAAACNGNPAAFSGPSGRGEVIGFLSADQATRLLQNTQSRSHMSINPDYESNVRSLVHLEGTPGGARYVTLVPKGTSVQVGDRVEVVGGHIDPSLPCHYIPNVIVRVQP